MQKYKLRESLESFIADGRTRSFLAPKLAKVRNITMPGSALRVLASLRNGCRRTIVISSFTRCVARSRRRRRSLGKSSARNGVLPTCGCSGRNILSVPWRPGLESSLVVRWRSAQCNQSVNMIPPRLLHSFHAVLCGFTTVTVSC